MFDSKELLDKKEIKLTYEYFDFHYSHKKSGIALLDEYIKNILRN